MVRPISYSFKRFSFGFLLILMLAGDVKSYSLVKSNPGLATQAAGKVEKSDVNDKVFIESFSWKF